MAERPAHPMTREMPRAALVAGVLFAALLASAPPADAAVPSVPLLAPVNGSTITYSPTGLTTFTWRVDWSTPEDTTVMWQYSTDPSFGQKVTQENRYCAAANVNCFATFQLRFQAPPPTRAVFYTKRVLPRTIPAGRYLACVTAWDKASNHAQSCATYRIR